MLDTFWFLSFRLKNKREMFLCYSDSSGKCYWKKYYLDSFLCLGFLYLLVIMQIGNFCFWCSNLMCNNVSNIIFFVMFIIWFYLKKMWKINILPQLLKYLCGLFGFQKLLRLMIVKEWIITCFQFDLKRATVKCHTKFFRFFYTISDKNYGKTTIWTILSFYPFPPHNNIEKQWTKLVSSYVWCWQPCMGGWGSGRWRGNFKLFKISIIFCHQL